MSLHQLRIWFGLRVRHSERISSPFCRRLWSGWADSNRRPRGPKPRALSGLRYTPSAIIIYQIFPVSLNKYYSCILSVQARVQLADLLCGNPRIRPAKFDSVGTVSSSCNPQHMCQLPIATSSCGILRSWQGYYGEL